MEGVVIEGRTELALADFQKASQTRLLLLLQLALALPAVFFLPALFTSKQVPWASWIYPPLFMSFVLLVVRALLLGAWATRVFRETVAEGAREVDLRLSERGLEVASSQRRVELSWSAVRRVFMTREAFVVTSPTAWLVLPFRAFNGEEVARVRKLIVASVARRSPLVRAGWLVLGWAAILVALLANWQYLEDTAVQPRSAPGESP